MDVAEIFLLFVVSLTVAVFLILQNLEESKRTRHESEHNTGGNVSQDKSRTGSSIEKLVKEIDDQDVKQLVGACSEAEQHIISENFQTEGREETAEDKDETGRHDCGALGISGNTGVIEDDCEILDDWEGVERTELEKLFGKAVVFVSYKNNADQIDGDLMLQLYGLQKVALQGPCHESQPMALKVSARSKWNAWQKLGNMSGEMAMEKYVEILSIAIPEWRKSVDVGTSEDQTSTHIKDGVANEMLSETKHWDVDPST